MKPKRIVILGSTGSIGINSLDVIEQFPEEYEVIGLSAYSNIETLAKQIKQYRPKFAAVKSDGILKLREQFGRSLKILDVDRDLEDLVSAKEVDIVVIGMSGSAALIPFLAAVRSGKKVATANKEALVIAGDMIMKEAKRSGAQVIPIDSEQSAIFQCLTGQDRESLKRVYLTASGGSLLRVPKEKFGKLSVAQILNHPRWKMGKRITVDSATLMNKGFEFIEAMRLFDLSTKQIEVLIHPEAIIHSMTEYHDGSIIAQLGVTDMRLPIQYALTYPERRPTHLRSLDFFKLKQLTFEPPDFKRFPCLSLAMFVAEKGSTYPSVLNAADEVAVNAFLQERIPFNAIFEIVDKVVLGHRPSTRWTMESVLEADKHARVSAEKIIRKKYGN